MLEEMQVITDRQERLSSAVAAEFPSLFISFAHDGSPHLRASDWERPDFDTWDFDVWLDELAREPFTLCVADDRGGSTVFALEVLNRCHRPIGRRNRHSPTTPFNRKSVG